MLLLPLAVAFPVLAAEGFTTLEDGKAILDAAPVIKLMSVDPAYYQSKAEMIHGHRILRSVELRGEEKARLLQALYAGMTENTIPAQCFNPRHAIRAGTRDHYVELLICFECAQIESWVDNGKMGVTLVNGSPQATFDQLLKK